MPLKIAISAGEVSGDEHAAKLASALRASHPDVVLRGMGGRFMRNSGVETIIDSESSASAMGIQELASRLPQILSALKTMEQLLREWKPDLLILIDFPDFNLRLARVAKSLGIKVFYFIIPKMWAWRKKRVELFKKFVDHSALIFPFEKDFCLKHGYLQVTYVGHPFCDEIHKGEKFNREEFCRKSGLDPDSPILAVLPGSRAGEIRRHVAPMGAALMQLTEKIPTLQIAIPIAPGLSQESIRALLPARLKVVISNGNAVDVMQAADVGLIKSGTANLQAAFCGLPFIMFYLVSRFSAWVARTFIPRKEYSIANVIRPGTVRELYQENTAPERVAAELEKLLLDKEQQQKLKAKLSLVVGDLASHDATPGGTAYERAANLAAKLISTEM